VRLFGWFGLRTEFLLIWGWLRWPATALMLLGAMALAYTRLPDVDVPFRLVTWGSLAGTLLWLAVTWGVGLWTGNVERLDLAYGSFASAMVLLTWFYLSAFAFLFGGLVDAVLQPQPFARQPRPVDAQGIPADSPPSPQ
jgi:membrane protein